MSSFHVIVDAINEIIVLLIASAIIWRLIVRRPESRSFDDRLAEEKTWCKRSGGGTISDQTLELVSNTNNIFKHPSVPDFGSYEDPYVSEQQLDEFVAWAGQTDRNKGRAKLSDLITTDLSIKSPEVGVDLMDMCKTQGLFQDEDYCVTGYMISKGRTGVLVTKNEDLVRLLISPNLMYWHAWDEDGLLHECPDDECWYLDVNDAEFVPQSGKPWDLFTEDSVTFSTGTVFDMDVYYEIDGDIPFFDEKYTINGTKFKIYKKEKDFLIILLMATYNSDLLSRVIAKLEA